MTLAVWGAVLGAMAAAGLLLAVTRIVAMRRTRLVDRVLPYIRDLPQGQTMQLPRSAATSPSAAAAIFGPVLLVGGRIVERVLGGAPSVRRRLERAGLQRSVQDFRIEQVVWGLVCFAVVAAIGLVRALSGTPNPIGFLVLSLVGFAVGVLARDNYLSTQATRRERAIVAEFPAVAELLALAVAAGEGPVAALDRVVQRSHGELSADLSQVLASVRTGQPVGEAFDNLASGTGLAILARFAQGIAIAVERGTPLADVLHAQAADVREAGRRELIEAAARKEVLMMVPVVFLVLPITVLFAFWPGLIGLSLTT